MYRGNLMKPQWSWSGKVIVFRRVGEDQLSTRIQGLILPSASTPVAIVDLDERVVIDLDLSTKEIDELVNIVSEMTFRHTELDNTDVYSYSLNVEDMSIDKTFIGPYHEE